MKKLKEDQTMFSVALWQWKSDAPLSVLALLQDLFSHLIGGSDALPSLIEAFGYLGNPWTPRGRSGDCRGAVGESTLPTGWWLGHPSEKYEVVNWDD